MENPEGVHDVEAAVRKRKVLGVPHREAPGRPFELETPPRQRHALGSEVRRIKQMQIEAGYAEAANG